MDDEEYNAERRNDYHVVVHLDAFKNGEQDDCNKYLEDYDYNPELIVLENEENEERMELLSKLAEAKKYLTDEQLELVKKVYEDKRTNVDIAAEEGVTETAICNRLKRIHEKLIKYFS